MTDIDAVDTALVDHSETLAKEVQATIHEAMETSERSQWAADSKIGVSDIGHCREYVRRMIAGEEFTDPQTDYTAAFLGTAVGDHVEKAYAARHPEVMVQQAVTVALTIGDYVLRLPGHPDLVKPPSVDGEPGQVVDFKTKNGLDVVRRTGPSLKERFQPTLYAKALIDDGVLEAENTICSLVYIDRSGMEPEPHVVSWWYDEAIVAEAQEWLSDSVYALAHGEEASKDKPRDWCFSYCPFATGCRGEDTDVTGLLEDPEALEAIDLYVAAQAQIREAEKVKDKAKAALVGRSGRTRTHTLRWVDVGPTRVSYERRGYSKLDIRTVKGAPAVIDKSKVD